MNSMGQLLVVMHIHARDTVGFSSSMLFTWLNNGVKFVYEFAKSKFTLIKTYKLRLVEGWWVQNNI